MQQFWLTALYNFNIILIKTTHFCFNIMLVLPLITDKLHGNIQYVFKNWYYLKVAIVSGQNK
jgi:hypothetical protein